MTAAIFRDNARARGALRALGLCAAAFLCLLAAGVLGITLLGTPAHPAAHLLVTLDLPPTAPKAAQPLPKASPSRAVAPTPPAITKARFAGKMLVADPALIEASPQGPLPRIADDGRMPMRAYAAPTAWKPGKGAAIPIAIVVAGLGQSAQATAAALAGLPAAVTLAFAPYAGDLQRGIDAARKAGHEVLLEVPMEPADFPDSDPGPHTLRAGADEAANPGRLDWVLSRATGYAGVTNFLGQRFLSDADALAPVLTDLARRGLYFYDDGEAAHSAAQNVASLAGAPFAQADETIDAIPSGAGIDGCLLALEAQARRNGAAVGTATLYPLSVAHIAQWAKTLRGRGFVLVPLSAIVAAHR